MIRGYLEMSPLNNITHNSLMIVPNKDCHQQLCGLCYLHHFSYESISSYFLTTQIQAHHYPQFVRQRQYNPYPTQRIYYYYLSIHKFLCVCLLYSFLNPSILPSQDHRIQFLQFFSHYLQQHTYRLNSLYQQWLLL